MPAAVRAVLTTIEKTGDVAVRPTESDTRIVSPLDTPAVEAVPAMTPLDACRLRPDGSVPEANENV